MLLYKFKSRVGMRVALTADPAGGNLPDGAKAWTKIGTIDVQAGGGPRIGASSDEIIQAIEKQGVLVWPIEVEELPPKATAA